MFHRHVFSKQIKVHNSKLDPPKCSNKRQLMFEQKKMSNSGARFTRQRPPKFPWCCAQNGSERGTKNYQNMHPKTMSPGKAFWKPFKGLWEALRPSHAFGMRFSHRSKAFQKPFKGPFKDPFEMPLENAFRMLSHGSAFREGCCLLLPFCFCWTSMPTLRYYLPLLRPKMPFRCSCSSMPILSEPL